MSQIYASAIVILLAQLLPRIGVQFDNDTLTQFAQMLVTIVAGAWIMVRRYQQGDIKLSGARKYRR